MTRRMVSALPWIAAGLILGLIVHIATVFALPRLAPADARARLADIATPNRLTTLSGRNEAALPLADPAAGPALWVGGAAGRSRRCSFRAPPR